MLLKPALAVLTSLVLWGCGFHLRGTGLSTSIEAVEVRTQRQVSVSEVLKRNLGSAGVALSQNADLVIDLLAERSERRSVSVTQQARTAEYELTLEVQYQISSRTGDVLIAPRWIQSRRNYRFDRFNIIGSSEEQALLEKEMRRDLAQQILRSLDALARKQEGAEQESGNSRATETS